MNNRINKPHAFYILSLEFCPELYPKKGLHLNKDSLWQNPRQEKSEE